MVLACVAFNCPSQFKKGSGISYHKFPSDPHFRNIWRLALRRKNFKPSDHSKLCSRHFTRESYLPERFGFPTLKKDAIPTIFDFPSHVKVADKKGNSRKKTSWKAPIGNCSKNGKDISNERNITDADVNETGESSPPEVIHHNSENGLLPSSSVLLTSENEGSSTAYMQSIAESRRLPYVYTQSVLKSSEISSTRVQSVVRNLHSSSAHGQLVAENAKITSNVQHPEEGQLLVPSFGIQLVPESGHLSLAHDQPVAENAQITSTRIQYAVKNGQLPSSSGTQLVTESGHSSFVHGQPTPNTGQIRPLTTQLDTKILSTDAQLVAGNSHPFSSYDQSVVKHRLSSFPIDDSLDAGVMSCNDIQQAAENDYPPFVVATLYCKNGHPDSPNVLSDAEIDHTHSYALPASKNSNNSKKRRKAYVGDFKATDMLSLTEAQQFYEMATAKILTQKREIAVLRRQNHRLTKQVQCLKLIIEMTDAEEDEKSEEYILL